MRREDLLQSGNAGIRWQAQMEEHLSDVRGLTSEAMRPGIAYEQSAFRAQLAQAHAMAALALATANANGDIAHALDLLGDDVSIHLDNLADAVREGS